MTDFNRGAQNDPVGHDGHRAGGSTEPHKPVKRWTSAVERPRRLRATESLRRLTRETRLSVDQLVYPLFVAPGDGHARPIDAMPGQFVHSVDQVGGEARRVADLGIPAVLLFGRTESKDPQGREASSPTGEVQRAVAAIKDTVPELTVVTDVCLCAYTDHGHCGIVVQGAINNDRSVARIVDVALSHADAGADLVAPSDMMDGRVGAIRTALDTAGHVNVGILAYAAKYASAFYGPFREAADSAPEFGDRRSYQLDPSNGREAIREVELDVAEGADIVMVKPALLNLDVVARVRETVTVPVAAYSVSGEYAAIKAAAARGWIDERMAALEAFTSIVRAGAQIVVTYYAPDIAVWLQEDKAQA